MVKVSVIIPSYNREEVEQAVKSALAQTVEDMEVIVVDDCSDIPVRERLDCISDERVTVIRHKENRNGAAARNTGIDNAKGQYVAFLDDDDFWLPDKLEKQLLRMQETNYGAVYSQLLYKSGMKNEIVGSNKEGDLRKDSLKMQLHGGFGSTLVVRKEIAEEVGGFNEDLERYQDGEFLIKIMSKTKIACVDEPLAVIYGHEGFVEPYKRENAKLEFLDHFSDLIDSYGFAESRYVRAVHYLELSWILSNAGDTKKGLKYLAKSLKESPVHRPKNLARAVYYLLKSVNK